MASPAPLLETPSIELSPSIATHVAHAAPMLVAIRVGSGAWVAGLHWTPGVVVTDAHRLPPREAYSVVLPGEQVTAAIPLRRDSRFGIAALRLLDERPAMPLQAAEPPATGTVLLVLGTKADATPTARLAVVNSVGSSVTTLAAPAGYLPTGGPVLAESGALVGLCVTSPERTPTIVPYARIEILVSGEQPPAQRQRRGWIGATLQPVAMRDPRSILPGQPTGRLVLYITPGGPADRAGVLPGDILLAVDGAVMDGHGSLRSVLGLELIGREVELVLTRYGHIRRHWIMVEGQPSA